MNSTISASAPVDIGYVLDDGSSTTMQKLISFLAAMAIVMDGFDGQLIGFTVIITLVAMITMLNHIPRVIANAKVPPGRSPRTDRCRDISPVVNT